MHYYQKNKEGRITAAREFEQVGFQYSEENIVFDYAGRLVFESETKTESYAKAKAEYEKEQYKNVLRMRREKECFAIADRAAWFYGLTEEQKSEVLVWREAWLNVTETLMIPEKPKWIK